jgi:hypothetical protein
MKSHPVLTEALLNFDGTRDDGSLLHLFSIVAGFCGLASRVHLYKVFSSSINYF